MKKRIFSFLLVVIIGGASQGALAVSPRKMGTWGLGAEIGSISSVSLQAAYQDLASLVFGVGIEGDGDDDFTLHLDHLWHPTEIGALNPYIGIGAGAGFGNDEEKHDTRAIVRIPAGLAYYTSKVPLNLFAQLVPQFDTNGDSDFEGQLGLRVFF
jgi:hypothetical protein